MKKTAVEWLIEQIKGYDNDCEIFEEAKEMEKHQIRQAYNDGKAAVIHIEQNMSLEEYYDKNYKNETK